MWNAWVKSSSIYQAQRNNKNDSSVCSGWSVHSVFTVEYGVTGWYNYDPNREKFSTNKRIKKSVSVKSCTKDSKFNLDVTAPLSQVEVESHVSIRVARRLLNDIGNSMNRQCCGPGFLPASLMCWINCGPRNKTPFLLLYDLNSAAALLD